MNETEKREGLLAQVHALISAQYRAEEDRLYPLLELVPGGRALRAQARKEKNED